jgi:hypothetical protein
MLHVMALIGRRAFRLGLLAPLMMTSANLAVLSSNDAASDNSRRCQLRCPPPSLPSVTFSVSLDGKALPAVSLPPAQASHTYAVTVAPRIPRGAEITKYWLGSARGSWGARGGPDGPTGVHVLTQGHTLNDGSQITYTWTPARAGRESLVIVYDVMSKRGGHDADARVGTSIADFYVR